MPFAARRAVVLATGGLSYPATGSTGDGYAIARALGHAVTGTMPAINDEGYILSESEAINEYLEECYPAPRMLPTPPRERATARMFCDVVTADGEPFEGDPRQVLRRNLGPVSFVCVGDQRRHRASGLGVPERARVPGTRLPDAHPAHHRRWPPVGRRLLQRRRLTDGVPE